MKKLITRITAMLLSGMLVIGSVPGAVFAADIDPGQTSAASEEVLNEDMSEASEAAGETSAESYPDQASAEEAAQYYTVTLDANGGYFENEWDVAAGDYVEKAEVIEKQIPVGGTVAAVPMFSDQDGQTLLFAGWSLERDGEITAVGDEGEYAPVDSCVLYAVWQAADEDAGKENAGQEADAIEESEGSEAVQESEPAQESDGAEAVEGTETESENTEESESAQEFEETTDEADTAQEAAEYDYVQEDRDSKEYTAPETDNEQDVAPAQEVIYSDEEETGEDAVDASVSEEEISPDLVESSKEEEAVREDATNSIVASGECGDNLTWTLDVAGTLTISGTGAMADYNGNKTDYDYSCSSPWFGNREAVRSVVFPSGITHIGNYAFFGCGNLDVIDLPESVTSLGYCMIMDTSITSIIIPKNVSSCNVYGTYSYTGQSGPLGGSNVTRVEFEDGMKTIPDNICIGGHFVEQFQTVTTPATIVQDVVIPDSVTTIGANAFTYCEMMSEINIPSSVTTIASGAFYSCTSLSKAWLVFDTDEDRNGYAGLTIESAAFSGSSLSEQNLTENAVSIGRSAFYGCGSLTEVISSAKTVGNNAFVLDHNLKTVVFKNVESLGASLFGYNSGSGSPNWPGNVSEIKFTGNAPSFDENTFSGCTLTAYYPESNNTWTSNILQNYGGNITWIKWEPTDGLTIDVVLEEGDRVCPYNGQDYFPIPEVTDWEDKLLIEGQDYTLAYENNRMPGTARVIATGLGEYEGLSGEAEFTIQGTIRAELTQNLFPSEGKEVKAPVKVWWEEEELEEGSDYTLSYKNNSNPGTASVVVTGTGYYTGTVQLDYTIAGAQGLQEKYEYTGGEICPVFSLVAGAKTLNPETDYSFSYEGNINPGPIGAFIKVQGKGTYKGSFKIPFSIVPRKVGGLTAKTFTQREMRLSFRDLECADGYRIRWWTEEDPDTVTGIDVENTRTENADNGLLVKEDENGSGINMAYYEGKESLPRAKRIVVQVCAYANMATDDPAEYEKSFGEYSDPVTFASGNQVIRKEMWGFTNGGESRDPSRQVEVSGGAHAEILTHINQSDGQCFGMCWAGAYSVQYGDKFGTSSLQNITSIENAANFTDTTLGMSAQDVIEYAQAINKSGINLVELTSVYDFSNNHAIDSNYFQYLYNRVKDCQQGSGEPVLIGLNGNTGNGGGGYNHALLALGISYEDANLVQIDVYDPNKGNADTHVFELYKDNGSLVGNDVTFSYITSDNTHLSGRLGDYNQLFDVDRAFFMCVNQNLKNLLDQVRNQGILTFEDTILFCYAPANNQDDYVFEKIEGDSAVTINDSYSPDGTHLMFRVSNTKGKILKIKSRKATIRFGTNEIEYEIILKMDEPCEILINIDNPSYPEITITQTSTGTDIGWVERRFKDGKVATTNMNLGAGTDGPITILPQADYSTALSGIASISAENLNGTFDGSGTVTENETTSMPVTTLIDNMEYSYSLHKDNPLLRQINSDGTDQPAIVFHIHDWNDWKTIQTPTVTAEGKMEHSCSLCGQKETKSIAKLPNLNNAKVTGLSGKTYTGKACTQAPTVSLNGKVLKKDTDYTISYKNNINAGTASMILIGKGKYGGKKTVNFTIGKAAQTITAKAAASSVAVGKTTTVSITGNKGSKSFKSSDTAVATVSSAGKVTAKKVGTVKITATATATANYKAASKTVTIKVVPAATTSLTATNLSSGIKLTWKKVTGATGYLVYRGSTKIATIKSGSTVTYADTKANNNGTKYTFKIIPTASTGNGTAKTLATYRVARPAISSVKNSASKKMTVKWGKNAKATGYQIQYSLSSSFASGNKAVTITSASTVSRVIGSLTKGKTYYVRIRTYKTVGSTKYWSEWSAKKSVKISK